MPKAFATACRLPALQRCKRRWNPFMAAVYSVRADRGNDHSKAKPNFEAGAAGGRGSAFSTPWSTATDDFVSVPMASFVTVGGTQARPLP
jgi:hypothetical protein